MNWAPIVVLFPELTLSGYPPEDLLFHRGLRTQIERALRGLGEAAAGHRRWCSDFPSIRGRADLQQRRRVSRRRASGADPQDPACPITGCSTRSATSAPAAIRRCSSASGIKLGLLVCEDVWEPEPAQRARELGAEVLLVINASPFEMHRQRERERVVRERVARVRRAARLREPVRRPGRTGVRRQLLRDGRRGRAGVSRARLHGRPVPRCSSSGAAGSVVPLPGEIAPELEVEASVYEALVLGVRDYVNKHGFPGVVMGLSGGVDSALTLAIAVDALGAERVQAVMMPSRYTSQMSKDDALAQARSLGVQISSISDRGTVRSDLERAGQRSSRAGRPTPPRRTSRRGCADCC